MSHYSQESSDIRNAKFNHNSDVYDTWRRNIWYIGTIIYLLYIDNSHLRRKS